MCALLGKVYHFTFGRTFHTGAIVLSAASSWPPFVMRIGT